MLHGKRRRNFYSSFNKKKMSVRYPLKTLDCPKVNVLLILDGKSATKIFSEELNLNDIMLFITTYDLIHFVGRG